MTAPRIRTVIIDDEPAARRGVRMLLTADPSIEIVGESGDHDGAVALIEKEKPELVFLDVQMPGGNGFAVLSSLPPGPRPVVIFITAFDKYAVQAFEVNAIDYLLKPYDDGRFHAAVARAKAAILEKTGEMPADKIAQLLEYLRKPVPVPTDDSSDRILIKSSGEIYVLKPEEIDWIEAEGDYMKFHVAGRSHLMRETMVHLEERLNPKHFVRIHRSVIVNIDRVRKLTPSFTGDYAVVLRDGTNLKLSRGYHDRLAEMLKLSL